MGNHRAVEILVNDNQVTDANSRFVNTRFAKGIYAGASGSSAHSIRTPQQMRNISEWTAWGLTEGQIFTQERTLDFTGISQLNSSVVGGIFSGTYTVAGGGLTINNVRIDASANAPPDNNNIGLFSQNNGTISAIQLTGATITGTYNVGGIVGHNLTGGAITGCTMTSSNITGNRVNDIAGRNDGTITNSFVNGNPVAQSGGSTVRIANVSAISGEFARIDLTAANVLVATGVIPLIGFARRRKP
jgi:hypothetical protein